MYWRLDLAGRRLVVHEGPDSTTSEYTVIHALAEASEVALPERPSEVVRIADLLPPRASP